MLILGLVLIVLSAAMAVLLIMDNTGGTADPVTMFGRELTSATVLEAFVAGMVVAAVFLCGLWLVLSAGRRARRNRAKYREARREAKVAAAERDELAEQLRHDEPVVDATPTPVGRHAAPGAPPHAEQPVITNVKPGDLPTR